MNYLHYELDLASGDVVEVTLDKQANVRLLDEMNFFAYEQGRRYSFNGGLVKQSPVRLVPPHPGHWHVVIDLEGYEGTVQASVRTLRGAT